MKRKQTEQGVGSLELLLDTICNTFGGILLISLLVAVLLNATSRTLRDHAAPPQSHAALLATEIDREELSRQLSDLRSAVKKREAVVGSLLPADLIAEAEEHRDAKALHAELVERKTAKVGGASRAQAKLNEIARNDADLRAKLEQARRAAADSSKQLADHVAARSRDASIPRLRPTATSSRAYFVTQQRLFGPWPHRQYAAGNDDEFVETTRGGDRILRPKPGAGIAIPANTRHLDEIAAKFANVDNNDEHVQVFVWPDSYGQFDAVRRTIAERGIMLELVPMARDADVTIGTSAAPAFVQ